MSELAELLAGRRRWAVVSADCAHVLPDLAGANLGALVTDAPYSSGGFTRGDRTLSPKKKYLDNRTAGRRANFDGDNRDGHAFVAWCMVWLSWCEQAMARGAAACLFSDWRQLASTTDALQAGGFVMRGVLPWTKKNATRPRMGGFRSDAEFVVWGTRGALLPSPTIGVLPGSFSSAPVHTSVRRHLTEKPLHVIEGLTRIAPMGSVILDPFAGSGTTGIAALRCGRRALLIERDASIAADARRRLEAEDTLAAS